MGIRRGLYTSAGMTSIKEGEQGVREGKKFSVGLKEKLLEGWDELNRSRMEARNILVELHERIGNFKKAERVPYWSFINFPKRLELGFRCV